MQTVSPDAEQCGVRSVRVGLDEGVGCEESIGQVDYKMKHEDDFFTICSAPLKVMLRSYLNGAGLGECMGD